MARSNSTQRGAAIRGITKFIRLRQRAVTVQRPTKTTNALDETVETTSSHQEDIYLFDTREQLSSVDTGERTDGDLFGLTIADGSVDIEHDDRITYGGVEYDVDTIVGYPEDGDVGNSPDTDYWDITFTRRQ